MGKWLQMMGDGSIGKSLKALPMGMTTVPLLRSLGLHREQLKRTGESGRQPRDYQEDMLEGLDQAFKCSRRVLLQVPSGSGKAFVATRAMRQKVGSRGARQGSGRPDILIVAHRPEVTGQISQILDSSGLKHKVLNKTDIQRYEYGDITVISAANAWAYCSRIARYYKPTMVIIDEVHSVSYDILRTLRTTFPDARMLGLTATPCTEDGKTLGKVFKRMIPSWSIKRLIAGRWLRDVDVRTIAGGTKDVELLYQAYKDNVNGKKGIAFAGSSRHARRIADCYQRHGVRSEVIGFDDSADDQEWKLNKFDADEVKVLVCVDYFSEGMRCPDVDFVQLAKPTDTLNTYLHQVGCAMRPRKDDEYGEDGITVELCRLTVLDHAGLSMKYGLPTDEHDWKQLFAGENKREVSKAKNKEETVQEESEKKMTAAAAKWQLRMQRLVGGAPSGQEPVKT